MMFYKMFTNFFLRDIPSAFKGEPDIRKTSLSHRKNGILFLRRFLW